MKTTIDRKSEYAVGERKRRPTHPGVVLSTLTLPAYGLSQTQLAERMGVSRRSINMICQGSRPVTVDMAIRLSRIFGSSAGVWLNLQQAVDVWQAEHEKKSEYERISRVERKNDAVPA